jgi:hypothetical protein
MNMLFSAGFVQNTDKKTVKGEACGTPEAMVSPPVFTVALFFTDLPNPQIHLKYTKIQTN